jgi:hypothetical protein
VIAFACPVSEPDAYTQYAGPGIARVKEANSAVFAFSAVGTIFRTYNLLLDAAAQEDDLEALVLVHPHAELTDPDFVSKLRMVLASDADIAIIGAVGARAVTDLGWWTGEPVGGGRVEHRWSEYGGGSRRSLDWVGTLAAPPGDADAVDGFLMVLSAWAVRNLRFDESLGLGHGYDVDICLQALAAGRRVVVADIGLIHHRGLELISDLELWSEAHVRIAQKWPAILVGADAPEDDAAWRERARRAEAERECERAIAYGYALDRDARVLALQREYERVTGTRSWWLTEPLRRLNKARQDRRAAP